MSMLFKRIKDWATSITAFRTGDVIPVDGPNGTAKMPKNDLLKETAQNALASNVAPAFDATKPNGDDGYAYHKGEKVVYNGKLYEFSVNAASGTWDDTLTHEINVSEFLDEINTLSEDVNGNIDGIFVNAEFDSNDIVFNSNDLTDDYYDIIIENKVDCQIQLINTNSSIVTLSFNSGNQWKHTNRHLPSIFSYAKIRYNDSPARVIVKSPSKVSYGLAQDVYGVATTADTTATYTSIPGEYIGSGVQIASSPNYSRTPCIAVTKGQHVIFSAGTKYNPNNVAVAMTSAASVSLGDVLDTSNYQVFGTTWTTENFDYEVPYDGYIVVAWSDTFAPTSITIRTITIFHDGLLLHKYVECGEQTLTEREKNTVRGNIGALGKNDVIRAMTPCLTILADDWGYTGGTREAKYTQLKLLCDTLGVKATWAAIPDGNNTDGYSYIDHYALTYEEMQLQGYSFLVHPNHDYWREYTDAAGMDRSTIGAVLAARSAGIENANFLVYPFGGGINANSFKMAYKWCKGVGINAGYAPYYNEYGKDSVNLNRLFVDDISAANIDSYKAIIANAYTRNAWVILGLHPVKFDNDKFSLLEELVNYAIGLGTRVATFQEAWNILRKNFK